MIRTAEQLAGGGETAQKQITIRTAILGAHGDLMFVDHLQKKYSHQLGFLPRQALEAKIVRGEVSLALENDEPAAYLLGNGKYLGDPHFGIIYQAAVSYDARRRLLGTALVQHFIDHMEPMVRLIGLWCAQDIEANEFWNSCGFEAIAARHGSRRRGRVHIFWVGRTPRGRHETLRYPRHTHGGLMREMREVFGIEPGEEYGDIRLPDLPARPEERSGPKPGRAGREGRGRAVSMSLAERQRAFRYGQGRHLCVVIAGATKYLPVAPFEIPNFTDLARVMVAGGTGTDDAVAGIRHIRKPSSGPLWTPAAGGEADSGEARAA